MAVSPGQLPVQKTNGRLLYRGLDRAIRSKADSRDVFSALCEIVWFQNSGLMIEFRLLVGIGRSGVMIGRICLNMVS